MYKNNNNNTKLNKKYNTNHKGLIGSISTIFGSKK